MNSVQTAVLSVLSVLFTTHAFAAFGEPQCSILEGTKGNQKEYAVALSKEVSKTEDGRNYTRYTLVDQPLTQYKDVLITIEADVEEGTSLPSLGAYARMSSSLKNFAVASGTGTEIRLFAKPDAKADGIFAVACLFQ